MRAKRFRPARVGKVTVKHATAHKTAMEL